ncbi:MAG: hypothetical protein IPJ34_03160 [Myxococcales bacterium]|nr:hypothetical protein [Myxococcales bacterium]
MSHHTPSRVGAVLTLVALGVAGVMCAAPASAADAELRDSDFVDRDTDPGRRETWTHGVIGFRFGQTWLSEEKGGTQGMSYAFSARNEGIGYRRGITTFHASQLVLGGGSIGLDGVAQGGFGIGFRVPIAENHGPFLRAAVAGAIRGNDSYYFSLIDVPQGQLGYQYLRGPISFDVAATLGWALDGRASVGGAPRNRIRGLERGLMATIAMRYFEAHGRLFRLDLRDDARTMDVGQASVCANAAAFALCGDLAWMRFAAPGTNNRADAAYAGFTVGFATTAIGRSPK